MKMPVILILLGILSVACRNTPLKHTSEQCSPLIVFTSEDEVDVSQSRCFCREYTFDLNYLGPEAGTDVVRHLSYCNKVVGFKKYTDLATFWEKVRREILDYE